MTEIGCPYKGLASFDDSDADAGLFFGRDREREIICANLMASKLTVLYGDTGVGKSSVLRAGVARTLRSEGDPLRVVVFDTWKDDPAGGLATAVAAAANIEPRVSLADTLEACSARLADDVYVILDGVEEYFLYHEGEHEPGTFFVQFPEAVQRPGLRVSFLLAVREDALAKLDRFKPSIPNLFGNYLRLAHLDRRAARSAIVGPVEHYNTLVGPSQQMEIEPALVDGVLDEVRAGRVDLGQAGRGVIARDEDEDRIEAPYLQLVMTRLWEAEVDAGSHVLRASTLAELGGAGEIVRVHLDRALEPLTVEQKDIAASIFNHLVTPSGAKIAHAAPDLARYAGVSEAELEPVLATLVTERILRPAAADGGAPRYEIYHDVLGEAVLAWRSGHEGERELAEERERAGRRQRRLLAALGVGGVLLAAMAGVTTYALTQRSDARSQARNAQARQLDSAAVTQLTIDPELSLLLAARAARLTPGQQTEETLRTAFIFSRQRGTLVAGGPVSTARYSPDGKQILTASADGLARLYDSSTRALARSFDHGAPVLDAAISPDGAKVLTGGADGTAKLWGADAGRLLATFRHGAPVRAASFDATGARMLTAGGRTVKIWGLAEGLVASIPWSTRVTSAAFAPDGRGVIVFGDDTTARLYDSRTGKLVRSFDQVGRVTSAVFAPTGGLLVTTGANETARIWRVGDGTLLHTLKGHRGSVLDAAFSPGGSKLATASADGTGRIWDVRTGISLATVLGHKGLVNAVAFSPDGNFVVTGSTDLTARVSKADSGEGRALLAGHGDSVNSAVFSPDGSAVLTASDDGTTRIWDPAIQPKLGVLHRAGGPVVSAAYIGRGDAVLVAGPGSRARVIRTADGRVLRTIDANGPVSAVAASPDGKRVAVAAGRTVTITGPDGKVTLVHPDPVTSVAFAPDGRTVATGGTHGAVRLWSSDGTLLRVLRGHTGAITDVAVSPDGERVATSSRDATARIWNVETGASSPPLVGHRDDVLSVAWSPDGRSLVTGSRDHVPRLWDTETGALVQVLRWHFGAVADASFSPDGRWILTAGPATVGLWQPGVRDPILPYGFGGHKPLLTSAVFDPTGRFVLTASSDGTVRTAECTVCVDLPTLLARADAQLASTGRALTREERDRYGIG